MLEKDDWSYSRLEPLEPQKLDGVWANKYFNQMVAGSQMVAATLEPLFFDSAARGGSPAGGAFPLQPL